ncbi:hypothetical protein ACFL2R_01510 [Patescibacteria group bacterium]
MGVFLDISSNSKSKLSKNKDYNDFKKSYRSSSHTLFSKGRVANRFYTEESGLYITPKEKKIQESGGKIRKRTRYWDGVSNRIVDNYKKVQPAATSRLYWRYRRATNNIEEMKLDAKGQVRDFFGGMSIIRLWNTSIVASMIVGMFFTSMVYRYLGQSASAVESIDDSQVVYQDTVNNYNERRDLREEWNQEKEGEYIEGVMKFLENEDRKKFEKEVRRMVKGYPIEKMVPYIMEQDRVVAAFLVGIGKKESNWGKRAPVLNGEDCYNYWGYRGKRERMGSGGHTCFDSPEDAVKTVAKRIDWLVKNKDLDTPEEMIIWKCGSSCAGHSPYSVRKWISDVDLYFSKLNRPES